MRLLYHIPISPLCRKIRMMLKEKDVVFELVQENPWEKNMRFIALNPAGDVPVLVEEDGAVISGNYALSEYIEDAYHANPLLGHTSLLRAEVRRLTDWFDAKFDAEVTQKIVFEKITKRLMNRGSPNSSALRSGSNQLLYHLDYIGHLVSERHFLAGDSMTLADITAAAHLSALDYLGDVPWEHNTNAAGWYGLMKSRPSLRSVLTDRVCGVKPPEYYEDPDF